MTDTTGHEPTPQPEPLTPESVAGFTDLLRDDLGVQHEDHLALVRRQHELGEHTTQVAIAERQRSWDKVLHSWRMLTVVAVVTGIAIGAGLLLRNRDRADPAPVTVDPTTAATTVPQPTEPVAGATEVLLNSGSGYISLFTPDGGAFTTDLVSTQGFVVVVDPAAMTASGTLDLTFAESALVKDVPEESADATVVGQFTLPITATPPTSPDSSDSSGEPAETGDGIRYFGGEVPLTVHMTGHQATLITTTGGVETVDEYADADETIDVSAWVTGRLEQAEGTHDWSMYLNVAYQTPVGVSPSWYVTFDVWGDVVLPG